MIRRIAHSKGDDTILILAIGFLILFALASSLHGENAKDKTINVQAAQIRILQAKLDDVTAELVRKSIAAEKTAADAASSKRHNASLVEDKKILSNAIATQAHQSADQHTGDVAAVQRRVDDTGVVTSNTNDTVRMFREEFGKWRKQFIIMQIVYMSTQILVALIILAISRRSRA